MRIVSAAICGMALCLGAGAASATVYKLDVTVTSAAGARFSAPLFDYYNLSSPGVQIDSVRIFNGPPWDWNNNGSTAPYQIINPAGGTRILLEGEEATSDRNNGCTPGLKYGFTGFDPGESFHFSSDPESSGCGSVVVDIRPDLTADILKATVVFTGGVTLTGNDWTLEYIDPSASHTADSNQRYRLTLESTVPDATAGVPEPASWALMIGGFGMAGGVLRRRRALA